jgi:cytochrome c5
LAGIVLIARDCRRHLVWPTASRRCAPSSATATGRGSTRQAAGDARRRITISVHSRIYEFKRGAQSGVERGKEIFYYKCWFCHNDLAEGAPKLAGVYQRGTLVTGGLRPMTASRSKSAKAVPGMASYKYTLSETDINDPRHLHP